MRYSRQSKIIEIINNEDIETQEQLLHRLLEMGYQATQSTVSRDIKELQLVKRRDKKGIRKYASPGSEDHSISARLMNIFRETILSYNNAHNLIIIKTLSGCGNAAAEAIDRMAIDHIVGSVAGDNTLLLVVDEEEHVPGIVKIFNDMIHNEQND